MIQRLATLLITLYISISLQAQDKKKPRVSPKKNSELDKKHISRKKQK